MGVSLDQYNGPRCVFFRTLQEKYFSDARLHRGSYFRWRRRGIKEALRRRVVQRSNFLTANSTTTRLLKVVDGKFEISMKDILKRICMNYQSSFCDKNRILLNQFWQIGISFCKLFHSLSYQKHHRYLEIQLPKF